MRGGKIGRRAVGRGETYHPARSCGIGEGCRRIATGEWGDFGAVWGMGKGCLEPI